MILKQAGAVAAVLMVLTLIAASATAQGPGPAQASLASLDLPLTVYDVAGVQRKQDICSTGVPLPCGLLKEPTGIAVFDSGGAAGAAGAAKAVPAQFRVLERWHEKAEGKDDGSVHWLLVTFLADVPKGGNSVYHLKAGLNPAPASPVTVEEKGDGWEMGGLSLKKDMSGPFRLVFTDADGKEISATELAGQIKWSVWEAGPVRSCVKAESPTVPGKFGFIAWIYGYAGQKRWDLTVVLKNTPHEMAGPLYFKDFSVIWEPAELKGGTDFALGGEWGKPLTGKLAGGEAAYLLQESDGTAKWASPPPGSAGKPTFQGYKAMAGEKELGAGNFAAGWATVSSQSAGGFAAVRNYYQQYPKATEVAAGKIAVHLWPKFTQANDGLHWLDDLTRKGHDLSFRVTGSGISAAAAEDASKALDFPLLATAPEAWNLAAGGFEMAPAGQYPPKTFAGDLVKAQAGVSRDWITFGSDVTDTIRRRYHGADRSGFERYANPMSAYNLYNVGRASGSITPLWMDDYQYPRDARKLTHAQYCGLARGPGKYRPGTGHHAYMCWNDSHFCCQEVFDTWRIFGDPLSLDAATMIGRWCQAYVDFREGGGGLVAGTRADGLPLYNLAEAYRLLGDESMRKSLDRFADVCWKQVNKERGNYGVMGEWEGGKDNVEKPFMMAQVMKGLRAYYELTGSQRTADQFLGMADFILAESSLGQWGYNYVVFLDPKVYQEKMAKIRKGLEDDKRPDGQRSLSYGDLSWVMAWAYRHCGEGRFRQAVDGLNPKAYPHVAWAYTGYYPQPTDTTPPEPVKDLAAESLGGGKVKLTWPAPAGAKGSPARYQVKWADKPMVERLNWPDEKDAEANWWAANDVEGTPKPAAAGARQSMVVEGVSPGKRFFAIRSFGCPGRPGCPVNRSAISNLAEAEVK